MNYLQHALKICFSFFLCLFCLSCTQRQDDISEEELVRQEEEESCSICELEGELAPDPQEVILMPSYLNLSSFEK